MLAPTRWDGHARPSYHTLCSARWEGWPSDHSARALANDYIWMAHYNARCQAMCTSPTADGGPSQRRCRRVAAQMRASPAGDAGACRCRWEGVGPGADTQDGAPRCGRAGRCARSWRRAEIKHSDVASSRTTQSEVSAQMRVMRLRAQYQRALCADDALFGIVREGYVRGSVYACMPWSACVSACVPWHACP